MTPYDGCLKTKNIKFTIIKVSEHGRAEVFLTVPPMLGVSAESFAQKQLLQFLK